MSLLSEKAATVISGQTVTADTINSNNVTTDVLVASEAAFNDLSVLNTASVDGAASAPAFLSPFQFQGFSNPTFTNNVASGTTDAYTAITSGSGTDGGYGSNALYSTTTGAIVRPDKNPLMLIRCATSVIL